MEPFFKRRMLGSLFLWAFQLLGIGYHGVFHAEIVWKRAHLDRDGEIIWTESKDGAFFVKSLYKVLKPLRQDMFPSRVIRHLQRRGWLLTKRCHLS